MAYLKAFFRYFRGEFNGFYLRQLQLVANNCMTEIKNELIYWNKGFDYIKEQLSDLNKFFDDRFDYSPCQSNCYRLTVKLDDCYYAVYITATRDISK